MQDIVFVREIDSARNRLQDRQSVRHRHWPSAKSLSQRDARQVLHCQVRHTAVPRVDAEIGHIDDMRMSQPSKGRGFGVKSCQELSALAGALDHLERDVAPEAAVMRQIDDAHSAATERATKLVLAINQWRTIERATEQITVGFALGHGIGIAPRTARALVHKPWEVR